MTYKVLCVSFMNLLYCTEINRFERKWWFGLSALNQAAAYQHLIYMKHTLIRANWWGEPIKTTAFSSSWANGCSRSLRSSSKCTIGKNKTWSIQNVFFFFFIDGRMLVLCCLIIFLLNYLIYNIFLIPYLIALLF